MISVTTHLYWITFQAFTNSSQVIEQVRFDGFIDEVLTVFCAEYDMRVDFG